MTALIRETTPQTNRKFKARQATEKRILEAATQVFTSRGFAAATIAEMVERSDLSRGGFYIHFDNKRDVFFALVSRAIADLYDIAPPLPDGSYRDRIRVSTRAYLQAFARHRGILRCLFETSTADAEIGALHNRYRAEFVLRLEQHFARNIASGRFRPFDPRAVSYSLGSLISGVAYSWLCADFEAWPTSPISETMLVEALTDIWCRSVFDHASDSDLAPPARQGQARPHDHVLTKVKAARVGPPRGQAKARRATNR